jgi:hypothetical protein
MGIAIALEDNVAAPGEDIIGLYHRLSRTTCETGT